MLSTRSHLKKILCLLTILFFLYLVAMGCAAGRKNPEPARNLGPVPLPTYKKGTTYIYSNGTSETVIDVAPDSVTWKNHRGYVSGGSPDFTYRRNYWQTRKRQGTSEFSPSGYLFSRYPTTLWPLQIGNTASYSEKGVWSEKGGIEKFYHNQWSCEVTGTEWISVIAGNFDTVKIVCKRYYKPLSPNPKPRLREVKTWYYSPEVRHYVLRTSNYTYDRPSSRLELVAVLPPPDGLSSEARRLMERSFQQALEFKKSGKSVPWTLPDKGIFGETKPTDTFQMADGTFCRRYAQSLQIPNNYEKYYGIACRNPQGQWVVPRQ